jgi:hypothetical protein
MKSYTVIYRTTYYPQNNASDIESFILQHIRDRIKITDLPEHNYRNIFLLSYRIWKLELARYSPSAMNSKNTYFLITYFLLRSLPN